MSTLWACTDGAPGLPGISRGGAYNRHLLLTLEESPATTAPCFRIETMMDFIRESRPPAPTGALSFARLRMEPNRAALTMGFSPRSTTAGLGVSC